MNDHKAAVNEAVIAARVAGRKAAEEIKPLLEWPNNHGADFADGFLSQMRQLLPQRKADAIEPEKPQPIARLGAIEMPFGAHAGKTLDDVPLEYLDWLCRSQEEFYKNLRAYLKHPELESRRRGIGA